MKNTKIKWFESGSYVAKKWKGMREERISKNSRKEEGRRRKEVGRSDRGGGCLHLITGLCPSHGQVYSSAPVLFSATFHVTSL